MLPRSVRIFTLSLLVSVFAAPGWSAENPDPWEKTNRKIYAFNKAADSYVLKPVAQGYRKITPAVVDDGISHFFNNLKEPLVALSNGLQGKGGQAVSDLGRFVVNSVTSLGFADVAELRARAI